MPSHALRTGVCLVRVESQSDGALITVTLDGDIAQNLRDGPIQRVMRFADADAALALVAQFVRSFGPPSAG